MVDACIITYRTRAARHKLLIPSISSANSTPAFAGRWDRKRPISPAEIFSSTVHGAFFLTRKAGLPRERKRSGSRGKRTSSEMSKFSPVGRKRAIWSLRGREWGVHSRRKAAFLQKTVGKILQKSAFSSLQGDFSMVYCSSARKCVSSYAPWLRFAALTGPTAQLCGDDF